MLEQKLQATTALDACEQLEQEKIAAHATALPVLTAQEKALLRGVRAKRRNQLERQKSGAGAAGIGPGGQGQWGGGGGPVGAGQMGCRGLGGGASRGNGGGRQSPSQRMPNLRQAMPPAHAGELGLSQYTNRFAGHVLERQVCRRYSTAGGICCRSGGTTPCALSIEPCCEEFPSPNLDGPGLRCIFRVSWG